MQFLSQQYCESIMMILWDIMYRQCRLSKLVTVPTGIVSGFVVFVQALESPDLQCVSADYIMNTLTGKNAGSARLSKRLPVACDAHHFL